MASRLRDSSTAILISVVVLVHLIAAPFTKIEESFNIEAVHDFLAYGFPRNGSEIAQNFEHALYPGPVPRTFVGPAALATVTAPFVRHFSGPLRQFVVRAALGVYNVLGILYYRGMVKTVYGQTAAHWFSLFTATQFHVTFWASRTLPNFFVYGWCSIALADLLPFLVPNSLPSMREPWRAQRALTALTIMGIVFRSEIAPLLATHALALLLLRRISLRETVIAGVIGIVTGLFLTVPLDSFLWDKYPEWPELTSFLFNVIQGKSSDWGVSPVHFYFTSALPRLLLNPALYAICIPFALLHPTLRNSAVLLSGPSLLFVAMYSLLPHKERRFIIYILPNLTTVAAVGASWIWTRRNRTLIYRVGSALLLFSVAASILGNAVMLAVSSMNYPGGHAVYALHRVATPKGAEVHVHLDTLTVMTGATHFMELGSKTSYVRRQRSERPGPQWIYDKTEQRDKRGNLTFWNSFDYALAEKPERVAGDWEIIETVKGYNGVRLIRDGEPVQPLGNGLVESIWTTAVGLMRRYVTRGRWIAVDMQPMIHVLRNRQRG